MWTRLRNPFIIYHVIVFDIALRKLLKSYWFRLWILTLDSNIYRTHPWTKLYDITAVCFPCPFSIVVTGIVVRPRPLYMYIVHKICIQTHWYEIVFHTWIDLRIRITIYIIREYHIAIRYWYYTCTIFPLFPCTFKLYILAESGTPGGRGLIANE